MNPPPKAPALPPRRVRRLATLGDVAKELGQVYRDCRLGILPPQDGSRLAFILREVREVIAMAEIEQRIEALEKEKAREFEDTSWSASGAGDVKGISSL